MPKALTVKEKEEKVLARTQNERPRATRGRNKFNGTEGKLAVNLLIDGYKLRVFNDTPGRIQDALDSGWEFVSPEEVSGVRDNVVSRNTDLTDKIRYVVNPNGDDTEKYGYLMKKRQEWFDEDQEELQAKNDLIDKAIQSGTNVAPGHSSEGFYVPKDGIKISRSNKF